MSKHPILRHLAVLAALALLGATSAAAQSANRIEVVIQGLRNDKGTVRCGLYASAQTFPKDNLEYKGVAATISNQQSTCVFQDVPPGKYAVAAFHAEDNETKMRYSLFGAPQEGYGFSRDASGFMGPPDFSDAAFDYAGGTMSMNLKLSY
jgi:uncharacterized protein (DUF2141 family)